MANLKKIDITDKLVLGIIKTDDTYLDRADEHLSDIILSKGLTVADLADPLPIRVKEWLRASVGYWVCFDNMALNDQWIEREEITIDPYGVKFKYYEKKLYSIESSLTKEIITGDADEPGEFAYTNGKIYRS